MWKLWLNVVSFGSVCGYAALGVCSHPHLREEVQAFVCEAKLGAFGRLALDQPR